MIVLHAAALGPRLAFWGESPPSTTSRRRRRRDLGDPSPSPLDPGPEALRLALEEVAPGLFPKRREPAAQPETLVAWLPSHPDGPIASSPMVAEPPANGAVPRVVPWRVAALVVPLNRAIDLLASVADRLTLAPGVLVGSTLTYWAEVVRFAGALVARQQFLPGVVRAGDDFEARWEPVVVGPDAHRRSSLAQAMPHACRALTAQPYRAPDAPAVDVLDPILAAATDALVRSAVLDLAPTDARRRAARPRRFDSLHDHWLHALRAPDPRMSGDAKELARLAEQVQHWRRPIDLAASAPFRLCFRLEEPNTQTGEAGTVASTGAWYVRYLLQAADDPSLLLPAAEAWSPRAARKAVFQRSGVQPREMLLSALGQASQICPEVERSLDDPAPGGFPLDVQEAHAFLAEKSWLLEQGGFGVLLPAWWTRKGTKLKLAARAEIKSPKMTSLAGLSLDQILSFRWRVALGDQLLTRQELEALAKLKAPLVQIRGQWVQLDAEEIQAALEFWKKKPDGKIKARDAVQMALGMAKPPGGLDFEGVEADGWFADLLDTLKGSGEYEALDPPEGFAGTLRPYQARGYSWLGFHRRWGFGACLADDMGLGKTIQTLALIQREWASTPARKRRPTLLICPMSVVDNWRREAERFTPDLPVLVHHGLGREKGAAFKKSAKRHALVLSSYALLHRDFSTLDQFDWSALVLDEAQNIKNPQTRMAQSARALRASHRIALTGTPVENHVGDLWSIMEFLNPGLLGSQAEFRRAFHLPIQAYGDADAAQRLRTLTAPFILRRLKTDRAVISDLPPKLEMKVFCHLTREQASLYEAVVEDATRQIAESEGIQRKGIILATLTKLKQVCNHPAQFLGDNSPVPGRSGKLARLVEMLEEAFSAGDRALIFTQFSEMGELLRRHIQETFGREALFLHGGVSKKARDTMVRRFQAPREDADAPRAFILTVKAGGTGLNLTAANHVFHYDRWWNPAVENQATDRAFRIGQNRTVQVHKFLVAGTLEEKIDAVITHKQEVAGQVVGTGEDWLTKLSTDDLRDLLTLRAETFAEA